MGLELNITTNSAVPLYRQIAEQVRVAVATGALAPGEQLPSVRAVAEQLVVNPNTVARAYSELVREGVAEAQPGRGLFVAERRTLYSPEERDRRLSAALDIFAREVLFLGFTREQIVARLDTTLAKFEAGAEEKAHE